MLENKLYRFAGLAVCGLGLAAMTGCACTKSAYASKGCDTCDKSETDVRATMVAHLPPDAAPGECFAQVYVPPKIETVSETVCIKPESERLEVVPARFEWVEEKICVKPASKQLEAVAAEHRTEQQTVQVQPGYRGWETMDSENCTIEGGRDTAGRVFCLVDHPPVTRTVTVQRCEKPACVREVTVPAEYQTVRVQKCVEPATTRKVKVPAEYDQIEKTVVVAPGRIEWQRAICERTVDSARVNALKNALAAHGYEPGAMNGRQDQTFWVALRQFQTDQGLGVGALTQETATRLGVRVN